MKRIFLSGLLAGAILSVLSYGGLFLTVQFFPSLFVDYNNPLFNSDGSRDLLFYAHAFVLSLALSWFWERCKGMFKGSFILRGLEFGLIYALTALLPVMWITFSSLDITFTIVLSWFFYGFVQSMVAGVIFARINP
jgi:hypothetical protein